MNRRLCDDARVRPPLAIVRRLPSVVSRRLASVVSRLRRRLARPSASPASVPVPAPSSEKVNNARTNVSTGRVTHDGRTSRRDMARARTQILVSACYGSAGDVMPCVWMANAIRARVGAETGVFCATNPYFKSALRDDVGFVAVGNAKEYAETLRRSTSGGRTSHARDGREVVRWWLSRLEEHFDAVTTLARRADRTIILAHTLDLVVRCVEELSEELDEYPRVECHSVVLSPALLRRSGEGVLPFLQETLWFLPRRAAARCADFLIDRVFAPELNAFRRKRLGLMTPVRGVFAAEGWFLCRHVIAMFPEAFSVVKSNAARVVHQIDFPCADADADADAHEDAIARAREFVTSDDAPTAVFVSASGHPPFEKQFLHAAAKAMARLGGGIAKAIFLTTDRSHFEKRGLPANALHLHYLPLSACVEGRVRFDVIVSHATIGCTAAALRSGTKQVVVPAAFDQHHNAALLSRLNVAKVIPMRRLTSKLLAKTLERALRDESMHHAAAKFAIDQVRSDPQARVADIITKKLAQPT